MQSVIKNNQDIQNNKNIRVQSVQSTFKKKNVKKRIKKWQEISVQVI